MTEYTPEPTKRGPGRPPRQQQIKQERRRRQGMGLERNLRLHVPEDAKDPNFHYHWINDKPGRIHNKTVLDDYDVVTQEMLENQQRVKRGEEPLPPEGEGTPVKRAVERAENGEWLYAYLCRKPLDYYKEDKVKEQDTIASAEKAMKQGISPGPEGLGSADHAYVPAGHQNIIG